MIVKNEEELLPVCLKSVRQVADEIVIVDTGSTDSTKDVANRFGAKVIEHTWHNDFAEARNVSLESASGDWILVLDADEELVEETRGKIPALIGSSNAVGFEITVRSEMPEGDILSYDDIRILRLFRNRKEFRYSMPIHEQIRPAIEKTGGKIIESNLVILHHGYANKIVQGRENRGERNLNILREAALKSPNDPYLSYQIGATLMTVGKRKEAYAELQKILDMNYSFMSDSVLAKLFMKLSQLAVEMDDNRSAIEFARKSLEYNPANTISKYVLAVAYLSLNMVMEGYGILLGIQKDHDPNIKLGNQLEHLLKACRDVLGI